MKFANFVYNCIAYRTCLRCLLILLFLQSLWTQDLSPNFHLFLCLAILKMEKDYIIENQYGFNEILKVL